MGKGSRPVIDIEKPILHKILDIIGISALLLALAFVVMNWSSIPESVPQHFNAAGEPDRWGDKWTIFLLPSIGVAVWISLTFLERMPHSFNYVVKITEGNAERQYYFAVTLIRLIKNEISIFFAILTNMIVQMSNGQQEGLQFWIVPVFMVILFGTIIIYMVKSIRWR
ncbi:DUF1648 domain-containing protein [Guptibacillus algicola]|uniref:DUF1648 domain-containing protein n=1 Tax=Guptibacillus algicola TaxID=225844 RepID=UPI001CD5E6A8|nr:DUF1648 domain-containing protein [Alkalihalobacillus algicola]MCA0988466.1 DUF1648 domain-containing protein [Alkalihalobacillus algicola]